MRAGTGARGREGGVSDNPSYSYLLTQSAVAVHVGEVHLAPRSQYAERLAEHPGLVGGEVDLSGWEGAEWRERREWKK